DHVVLATAPLRRRPPLRRHVAEPAETVEQRVEHPVAPLELPGGECTDPLEDRVAIALTVGQDRQHERCRRGRDEVLVDTQSRSSMARSVMHRSTRYAQPQGRLDGGRPGCPLARSSFVLPAKATNEKEDP